MVCPKCNNKINYGLDYCPYCNHNISFTTKIRTDGNIVQSVVNGETIATVKKSFLIGFVATMIVLVLFIYAFSSFGTLYFNGILRIIDICLKTMLGIGCLGFVIYIILIILKKSLNIRNKILVISLVLIIISLLSKSIIVVNGDFDLKDYTKVKYIEIGSEKIPSIYSVIGKRRILMNHKKEDTMDEDFKIMMDVVGLIYTNLTTEDIVKYKESLIDYGFVEKEIHILDSKKTQEYLMKNNIEDNTFYVITIDGSSIIYSTSSGTYQEVFNIK